MPDSGPSFTVRLAETEIDLRAAQALRYEVFVKELGATGTGVDHNARIESDAFDAAADHMLVFDETTGRLAGVYRLMQGAQAHSLDGFYSEQEFDLTKLKNSGKRLLELGRSCLHPDYRGGMAMFHLWNGLADYVAQNGIELLFGVASFHGTDVSKLSEPLALLYHNHLADRDLRVTARPEFYQSMDLRAPDTIDRKRAMTQVPALIKAYLRLGGKVGEGAFVDHSFNTTDICLILDTNAMNQRQQRMFGGARPA